MPPPRKSLTGLYVLLVDDSPDMLEVIGAYLRYSGMHVVTAKDAAEALEYMKMIRPHVIVTDYNMPGMNGLDFLAQVRKLAEQEGKPIPAILCTAVSGLEAEAKAAGCSAYIVKPMDPTALLEEIARIAGV